MRRGSLFLLPSCAVALMVGVSYLGESPAQASTTPNARVEGNVSRLIEARQTLTGRLGDAGREIAYGLERAKDELEDLIP